MTRFIRRNEITNQLLGGIPHSDRVLLEGEKNDLEVEGLLTQKIPEGEIWLYHPFIEGEAVSLSLLQLLLDEHYADGYINIPMEAIEDCGYLNEYLSGKRIYELLLRLAEKYPVIGIALPKAEWLENKKITDLQDIRKNCDTDYYIVGKYSRILQEKGYFQVIVGSLVQQAENSDEYEKEIAYLEDMIGHGKQYDRIASGSAPILIYYGVTYCYNVMNVLLEHLAEALRKKGINVLTYDEQREDIAGLSRFAGMQFRGIIGVQTYLMSIYMKETERFLHDELRGPKFNIVLDHPFWLKNQLAHVPQDYYVLAHDENYRTFIRKYYPRVRGSFLFPPAGICLQEKVSYENRKYGMVFIGTYGDYREKCAVIRQCNRKIRFLANRFLLYMRGNTDLTVEEAFAKALEYYGITLTDEEFLKLLYEMGPVLQCVMYYYREKVIETLIKAGIHVDIWGESWKKSKLLGYPELVIHQDVESRESLAILNNAKVSLNVMAWHKGGFTERIANSMLAGAAVLTDKTTYNEYGFCSGEQCMMFSLEKLEELPYIAKHLLEDDKWRQQIAKRGYEYAKSHHTWDDRAQELLALIDEIGEEGEHI